MIHPHQDQHPLITADVTVYRVRGDDEHGWHVVVKYATPNQPQPVTVARDYSAELQDNGYLPDEAATNLLRDVMLNNYRESEITS